MHSNILTQLHLPRRDKRKKKMRKKRTKKRVERRQRTSLKQRTMKKKIRGKEGRDELFMCCSRRGQLWPVDTR